MNSITVFWGDKKLLKKFLNHFKKKSEQNQIQKDENKALNLESQVNIISEEGVGKEEEKSKIKVEEKNINTTKEFDNNEEIINNALETETETETETEFDEVDKKHLLDAKIVRGKNIKAINVYNNEEQVFENHKQCSKALNIPIEYIRDNLRHGYTDYLGEAIKYLSKELKLNQFNNYYINNNKSPLEIYNELNNKIFTLNISESKRDDILSNDKIDPIKMHYKFEVLDDEYDKYYTKYKSIIKRGGKKKIDLLNSKGEVIEVFKSLDECSKHLNKNKTEITNMLKYKENKFGRYEIRYSLRRI